VNRRVPHDHAVLFCPWQYYRNATNESHTKSFGRCGFPVVSVRERVEYLRRVALTTACPRTWPSFARSTYQKWTTRPTLTKVT
jgi:hypothetical protein